jgi:hypothetical protein
MDGWVAFRHPCRGAMVAGGQPWAAQGLPPANVRCPSGTWSRQRENFGVLSPRGADASWHCTRN